MAMCFMCITRVNHELRKARAVGAFRRRNEDEWFKSILDSAEANMPIDPTGFRAVDDLQAFFNWVSTKWHDLLENCPECATASVFRETTHAWTWTVDWRA